MCCIAVIVPPQTNTIAIIDKYAGYLSGVDKNILDNSIVVIAQ